MLVATESEHDARLVRLLTYFFTHRDPVRGRIEIVLGWLRAGARVLPLTLIPQYLDDRLRIGPDLIHPSLDSGILDSKMPNIGDEPIPVAYILCLLDEDPQFTSTAAGQSEDVGGIGILRPRQPREAPAATAAPAPQ